MEMANTNTVFRERDAISAISPRYELRNCSVGMAPSGYFKVRLDISPADLVRLVGYDPRNFGKTVPTHLSADLIELVQRIQRTVDQKRVDAMIAYLVQASQNGEYGDWGEIDLITANRPDMGEWGAHKTIYFASSAWYFVVDGQHRFCALIDLLAARPDLANKFTQSVAISVMPHDKLAQWGGQSFHDRNYLHVPVKATKALATDTRDLYNLLAKEVAKHSVIQQNGGVDYEKDLVAAAAETFISHSTLYRFVKGFVDGRRGLDKGALRDPMLDDETLPEWKEKISKYLNTLDRLIPSWHPAANRAEFLSRAPSVIQALAVIGHDRTSETQLQNLLKLDWRRTNLEWADIVGNVVEKPRKVGEEIKLVREVSPRTSRSTIDATIKKLREVVGHGETIH